MGYVANLRGPDLFVIGQDNNAFASAGTQAWHPHAFRWKELGTADPNDVVVQGPAVTFQRWLLMERQFVFVIYENAGLAVNVWNGNLNRQGTWEIIGGPPQGGDIGQHQIEAVMFPSSFQFRAVAKAFVFPVVNGQLWACRGNGTPGAWSWRNLESPDVTTVASSAAVVTWTPARGTEQIFAFVRGGDDHLWLCTWDGKSAVMWEDLSTIGLPPS
jgi:hypothetical protein